MAVAGGTSLCFINKVCNGLLKQKSLPVKCVAGSFIITGVELATGLVVNVMMKKKVWDYSNCLSISKDKYVFHLQSSGD